MPAAARCDAECEDAWPPVLTEAAVNGQTPGLQPGLLSSQPRPDGAAHVVYAGHPLYRYAGDQGAGSTAGDGVRDRWGTWHLLSSAGTFVSAKNNAGDDANTGTPADRPNGADSQQ